MKRYYIELVCRTVVSVTSIVCTTIAALKFQNAAILWWYMPVFLFITYTKTSED